MVPMIIWNRKHLPPDLATNEVPGTVYGLSVKVTVNNCHE